MKAKIYIQDWKAFKPYNEHSASDLFYLKVANEVCDELIFYFGSIFNDEVDPHLFSCFITSYFEDVISKTRIFDTFRNKHQEMYGKKLPFFDCSDEYFDDEINPEDIAFLTWYFVNTCSIDRVIHPNLELLLSFANDVIEIFDRHYEFAPENNNLQECYKIELTDDLVDQYFNTRKLVEKLFLESYLFIPDIRQRCSEMLDEIKEVEDKEFLSQIVYAATTEFLLNQKSRLLHLRGNEMVAEYLGKEHSLFGSINEISEMLQGNFEVIDILDKHIVLKHLASEHTINLLKESYNNDSLKIGEGIFIGVCRFMNEWIHVGISYSFEISDSIIAEEKKDFNKSILFNKIFKNEKIIKENLKNQLNAFYRITGGKDYVFLKNNEISQFMEEFILSNSKPDYSRKFISKIDKNEETVLTLFFNPKSGIEILENIQGAFFEGDNEFLTKENSETDFPYLLFTDNTSKEIVQFCLEKFKNKIPFFNLRSRNIYLSNLDFTLRFFKPKNYNTEPSLKFI